jgi:hypothetical protein
MRNLRERRDEAKKRSIRRRASKRTAFNSKLRRPTATGKATAHPTVSVRELTLTDCPLCPPWVRSGHGGANLSALSLKADVNHLSTRAASSAAGPYSPQSVAPRLLCVGQNGSLNSRYLVALFRFTRENTAGDYECGHSQSEDHEWELLHRGVLRRQTPPMRHYKADRTSSLVL